MLHFLQNYLFQSNNPCSFVIYRKNTFKLVQGGVIEIDKLCNKNNLQHISHIRINSRS